MSLLPSQLLRCSSKTITIAYNKEFEQIFINKNLSIQNSAVNSARSSVHIDKNSETFVIVKVATDNFFLHEK